MTMIKDTYVMMEIDSISEETDSEFYVHIRLGKRQWVVAERWIPKDLAEPKGTFKVGNERVRMYVPAWFYKELGFSTWS